MTKSRPVFVKHVACPSCGELERCDYVEVGRQMTWWCANKQCGKQYSWVELPDGTIEAEATGVVTKPVIVGMEFRPRSDKDRLRIQVESITFPVSCRWKDGGRSLKQSTEEEMTEHLQHHLEVHTCPTNYLTDIKDIKFYNGAKSMWVHDPHGLFVPRWWSPASARGTSRHDTAERVEGGRVVRFPRGEGYLG